MGTLTIPETFTGDSVLQADHLDTNFAAIRNYFNGVAGGIDAANINANARIALSQVAEQSSVSHLTWCCYVGGATGQKWWNHFPFPTEILVRSMRVNVLKNSSGQGSCYVYLYGMGEVARLYYDDSVDGGTGGFRELQYGQGGPPGTSSSLRLAIDSTTSAVEMVSVQLEIVRQHVKV